MAEEGCDVEQSQSREGQGQAGPGQSQGSKGLKAQPLDSYRHVCGRLGPAGADWLYFVISAWPCDIHPESDSVKEILSYVVIVTVSGHA